MTCDASPGVPPNPAAQLKHEPVLWPLPTPASARGVETTAVKDGHVFDPTAC